MVTRRSEREIDTNGGLDLVAIELSVLVKEDARETSREGVLEVPRPGALQ